MGELKRGVIDVAHPAQIADAARQMSGLGASTVPYVQGANYIDDDGNPLVSIPDPGPQPGDMDVAAINSPGNYETFLRRSAGRVRRESEDALPVEERAEPNNRPAPEMAGNFVHLDDGFAHLDGQLVPLDGMDLARIGGIVVRALERKMKEDYARIKSAYGMRTPKRKPRAVRRTNKKRSKPVPETSGGSSTEPAAAA